MKQNIIIDTVPLVALINNREQYHSWATQEVANLAYPFFTCEAVITETCINQAETINAIYGNFPDYWWDARQEIDLRTELYATIYPITSSVEQTIQVTNNLLKLERVES